MGSISYQTAFYSTQAGSLSSHLPRVLAVNANLLTIQISETDEVAHRGNTLYGEILEASNTYAML